MLAVWGATWVGAALPASAQESREYAIKAAYLYNFALNVTWPDETFENAQAPFIFGVVGPAPIDQYLATYARTKKWNGREIVFRRFAAPDKVENCQILLVSSKLTEAEQKQAITKVARQPVLIVGESATMKLGGTIDFFPEQNNIRFRLSMKAARRANLKISAKLARVGEVVDDDQ